MQAVLTVEEMRAVDRAAQVDVGLETLIGRAGRAATRCALGLLGGGYGRRVVIVTGKGNNGNDGRVAARQLAARGVRVTVYAVGDAPPRLPSCDLVIDAAFGTGFHGSYVAPSPPGRTPVLALDIASGLDADSGAAGSSSVSASTTITFGAYKPGLLLGEGPQRSGSVELATIGLDCSGARQHLVGDEDLAWLAPRARDAHKWSAAVRLVAGSPGMAGAARLAALGAMRSGAGMVHLGSPGLAPGSVAVTEAVERELAESGFAATVLADLARFSSLVLGPGLGRAPATVEQIRRLVAEADIPLVLDADGLNALRDVAELATLVAARRAPLVITPHEGEFTRLTGAPIGADRLAAVQSLAASSGVTVLLKGPATIVASPDGETLFCSAGSPRLATAGTGDVLSGVVGAFLARGLPALRAAALAAHVHGRAALLGPAEGLLASDLPALVATVLSAARAHPQTSGGDDA